MPKRGAAPTSGFVAFAKRCVPLLGLPLTVATLQPRTLYDGSALICVAGVCGIGVAVFLGQLRFSVPLSVLIAFFLLSHSTITELKEAEVQWIQHARQHARSTGLDGRSGGASPARAAASGPLATVVRPVLSQLDSNNSAPPTLFPVQPAPLPTKSSAGAAAIAAAERRSAQAAQAAAANAAAVMAKSTGSSTHLPPEGAHDPPHGLPALEPLKGLDVDANLQLGAYRDVPGYVPPSLETFSVVLPCAFEHEFAVKTVMAIWDNSVKRRIAEIIVVDDGSEPPLQGTFSKDLLEGGDGLPNVRLLRNDKTLGLIAAKKIGGDAARGDVIVFFDCHVSPRRGWEEAFLKQMKRMGDHRTVVVPTITTLNPETWQEVKGGQGKACMIEWNADFTWTSPQDHDVPLMSGGLLGISRQWWNETGGLDSHMVAWGGENIDQSLRTWLCGGRIELADGAFVAHMWRDPKNPKTRLKYPIPTMDVMRNKARAVTAWFGEFKEKVFTFPEYDMFVSGGKSIGNMDEFDELKSRLQCRPFADYLTKFKSVYFDAGLVPQEVYQLQEEQTGWCLQRNNEKNQGVLLAPCGGGEGGGPVAETQWWHRANRGTTLDHRSDCCSGIANWNFFQCLTATHVTAPVSTSDCNLAGHYSGQHFLDPSEATRTDHQLFYQVGKGCIVPAKKKAGEAIMAQLGSDGRTQVEVLPGSGSGPSRIRVQNGRFCLTVPHAKGAAGDSRLQFHHCAPGDDQLLEMLPGGGGHQLRSLAGGMQVQACLEVTGAEKLLMAPCDDVSTSRGQRQVWHVQDNRLLSNGLGIDIKLDVSVSKEGTFGTATCAPKKGQRFLKSAVRDDGEFFLKDADAEDRCLCEGTRRGVDSLIAVCTCGAERDRWKELRKSEQVFHVGSGKCLDAADGHPVLYPCHTPTAYQSQRWEYIDVPGWLQQKQTWGDNGRKRTFPRCLDYDVQLPMDVQVRPCAEVRQEGWRWKKRGVMKPLERKLWEKTQAGTE